jgi:hypothetical protein
VISEVGSFSIWSKEHQWRLFRNNLLHF